MGPEPKAFVAQIIFSKTFGAGLEEGSGRLQQRGQSIHSTGSHLTTAVRARWKPLVSGSAV